MSSCGILYVATKGNRYIEEALISADSVKQRFPHMPITIFTDRPHHPVCALGRFDQIVPIESETGYNSNWIEAQMDRLLCLLRTPYSYTLHIDCDTRVVTNELPVLFDYLQEFDVGMVETSWDDSYSRYHYARPMFNGGLVLYRRNDLTWTWLKEWISLAEKYFRMAGQHPLPELPELAHVSNEDIRRNLLSMDQISLCQILSPDVNRYNLRLKNLSYSWNHRGSALPARNREAVRIIHYGRLPNHNLEGHAANLQEVVQRLFTAIHQGN